MYHVQLESEVFVDLLQSMRECCVVVDDDPVVGEKLVRLMKNRGGCSMRTRAVISLVQ